MTKLPTTYRKNGFWFNRVSREGDVCIYSQHMEENGPALYYEVFIVQKNGASLRFGKFMDASETCPPNEQWGTKGWTYGNLADAEAEAEIIRQRIDHRTLKNGISPESILPGSGINKK